MATKRNFLRLPGQPGSEPVAARRIVIELHPEGGSLLKTYGPVTMPQCIDALMAQTASVWKKWIETMTSAVTDPSTGLPAMKSPQPTPMTSNGESFSQGDDPVCNCGLDPYKAPEQHADDCPIRIHQKQVMQ